MVSESGAVVVVVVVVVVAVLEAEYSAVVQFEVIVDAQEADTRMERSCGALPW